MDACINTCLGWGSEERKERGGDREREIETDRNREITDRRTAVARAPSQIRGPCMEETKTTIRERKG